MVAKYGEEFGAARTPAFENRQVWSCRQQQHVRGARGTHGTAQEQLNAQVRAQLERQARMAGATASEVVVRPTRIAYGDTELYTPVTHHVEVMNPSPTATMRVFDVIAEDVNWQLSAFKSTELSPLSKLRVPVIFLPRRVGPAFGRLVVRCSSGDVSVDMAGHGLRNRFRVSSFTNIVIPVNTRITPPIELTNPYEDRVFHVREVFTTESFLHLTLPNEGGAVADRKRSWAVEPGATRSIISLSFMSPKPGLYQGFVHIKTEEAGMIVPIEVRVVAETLQYVGKALKFGVLTGPDHTRSRELRFTNTGSVPIKVSSVRPARADPRLTVDFRRNAVVPPNSNATLGRISCAGLDLPGLPASGKVLAFTNHTVAPGRTLRIEISYSVTVTPGRLAVADPAALEWPMRGADLVERSKGNARVVMRPGYRLRSEERPVALRNEFAVPLLVRSVRVERAAEFVPSARAMGIGAPAARRRAGKAAAAAAAGGGEEQPQRPELPQFQVDFAGPVTIQPNETLDAAFALTLAPGAAQADVSFTARLVIRTNVTKVRLPLTAYSGRLDVVSVRGHPDSRWSFTGVVQTASSNSTTVSLSSSAAAGRSGLLDYGDLAVGASRLHVLLFHNGNPHPVPVYRSFSSNPGVSATVLTEEQFHAWDLRAGAAVAASAALPGDGSRSAAIGLSGPSYERAREAENSVWATLPAVTDALAAAAAAAAAAEEGARAAAPATDATAATSAVQLAPGRSLYLVVRVQTALAPEAAKAGRSGGGGTLLAAAVTVACGRETLGVSVTARVARGGVSLEVEPFPDAVYPALQTRAAVYARNTMDREVELRAMTAADPRFRVLQDAQSVRSGGGRVRVGHVTFVPHLGPPEENYMKGLLPKCRLGGVCNSTNLGVMGTEDDVRYRVHYPGGAADLSHLGPASPPPLEDVEAIGRARAAWAAFAPSRAAGRAGEAELAARVLLHTSLTAPAEATATGRLVWPALVPAGRPAADFGVAGVGRSRSLFVRVTNPSQWPMQVLPLYSDARAAGPFRWDADAAGPVVVPPHGHLEVGPALFEPVRPGDAAGTLYLRTNLTRLSEVRLAGHGGRGELSAVACPRELLEDRLVSGMAEDADTVRGGGTLYSLMPDAVRARRGAAEGADTSELAGGGASGAGGGDVALEGDFVPLLMNATELGLGVTPEGSLYVRAAHTPPQVEAMRVLMRGEQRVPLVLHQGDEEAVLKRLRSLVLGATFVLVNTGRLPLYVTGFVDAADGKQSLCAGAAGGFAIGDGCDDLPLELAPGERRRFRVVHRPTFESLEVERAVTVTTDWGNHTLEFRVLLPSRFSPFFSALRPLSLAERALLLVAGLAALGLAAAAYSRWGGSSSGSGGVRAAVAVPGPPEHAAAAPGGGGEELQHESEGTGGGLPGAGDDADDADTQGGHSHSTLRRRKKRSKAARRAATASSPAPAAAPAAPPPEDPPVVVIDDDEGGEDEGGFTIVQAHGARAPAPPLRGAERGGGGASAALASDSRTSSQSNLSVSSSDDALSLSDDDKRGAAAPSPAQQQQQKTTKKQRQREQRELEQRQREQHMRQQLEREKRQQREREQREREQREHEQREREQREREQREREQREREQREREQREREQREREQREREQLLREQREREQREREQREREQREQQRREQLLREQREHDEREKRDKEMRARKQKEQRRESPKEPVPAGANTPLSPSRPPVRSRDAFVAAAAAQQPASDQADGMAPAAAAAAAAAAVVTAATTTKTRRTKKGKKERQRERMREMRAKAEAEAEAATAPAAAPAAAPTSKAKQVPAPPPPAPVPAPSPPPDALSTAWRSSPSAGPAQWTSPSLLPQEPPLPPPHQRQGSHFLGTPASASVWGSGSSPLSSPGTTPRALHGQSLSDLSSQARPFMPNSFAVSGRAVSSPTGSPARPAAAAAPPPPPPGLSLARSHSDPLDVGGQQRLARSQERNRVQHHFDATDDDGGVPGYFLPSFDDDGADEADGGDGGSGADGVDLPASFFSFLGGDSPPAPAAAAAAPAAAEASPSSARASRSRPLGVPGPAAGPVSARGASSQAADPGGDSDGGGAADEGNSLWSTFHYPFSSQHGGQQ